MCRYPRPVASCVQPAGIGPFLGVFLHSIGWRTGAIGTVMTIGGVAGLLVTAPAGAVIDATRYKRLAVAISCVCTVLASCIVWYAHSFAMVATSQVATAIAGALLGPAIAGMTLGMARAKGFDRQFGRNQVANHAGNVVGAGLSGYIGWHFGFGGIFLVAAAFGVFAVIATLLIPERATDPSGVMTCDGLRMQWLNGCGLLPLAHSGPIASV